MTWQNSTGRILLFRLGGKLAWRQRLLKRTSVDTPIIIEDSASKTESEDALPPAEGLLLERKVATPVAAKVGSSKACANDNQSQPPTGSRRQGQHQ